MSNGINSDTNFGRQDGTDLREVFKAQFENLKTLIDANDKNYNQRFDNVTQATSAALASADRANTKAETATEKRFDSVNEFRATLQDQQRTFIPRMEMEITLKGITEKLDASIKTTNEKIDALNLTTITKQSKDVGIREGWGQIAIVAGVVSVIVAILFRFIK
jgi:predicted nucleotide-binding protein (sugar kinase/HSP70/actin superfamily)